MTICWETFLDKVTIQLIKNSFFQQSFSSIQNVNKVSLQIYLKSFFFFWILLIHLYLLQFSANEKSIMEWFTENFKFRQLEKLALFSLK